MTALMLEPGSDKLLLMLAMASSPFYFPNDFFIDIYVLYAVL